MPIFNVCGTNYQYPNVGEKPWGTIHIAWAAAVSSCVTAVNTQVSQLAANQFVSPMLVNGDIIIQDAGVPARLPIGAAGQVLAVDVTGLPFWTTVAGTGDVVGPASSVDNRIVTFDGITGKLIKDSLVNIDASQNVTGVNDLTVNGNLAVTTNATVTGTLGVTGVFTALLPDVPTANAFWDTYTRSTGTSVGVRGVAISDESGVVSESTTTPQSLGVSATITTTGRPIWVGLTCDNSIGYIEMENSSGGSVIGGYIHILRDGTEIYQAPMNFLNSGGINPNNFQIPLSVWTVTNVAAGTYVFTAAISRNWTSTTVIVDNIKIVAFEL